MSIEKMNKIKKLRKVIGGTDLNKLNLYDVTLLASNIADYLIEQEEQKEEPMFIVKENGDVEQIGMYTQKDLDKAREKAKVEGMIEGFRQGYDEAFNPQLIGSKKIFYTQCEMDNQMDKYNALKNEYDIIIKLYRKLY